MRRYVQLLPFASDESAAQLQANLQGLADMSPTTMVRKGLGPEQMLELLLEGLDMQVVCHATAHVEMASVKLALFLFQILTRRAPASLAQSCKCSNERIMRTLRLLPSSEVRPLPSPQLSSYRRLSSVVHQLAYVSSSDARVFAGGRWMISLRNTRISK